METFKESYTGGLDMYKQFEQKIHKQFEQKIQEIYEMYKTDAAITKEKIEELKK